MKLKAIYLLAIFILLAACSPQGTATPEAAATLPPPTETLVPTPTVHPQFLEWQESIAALSERFSLMSDGSIQDNGVPVPGVRVSPDGVMTLTLADGTVVTLDSSDVSFDDEKGFGVEGYELDSDLGTWEEVVAGYTLEQLAEMSPSEIISLAPEVPEIERPEWAVGNYTREVVTATDILTGQPVYAVVSRAENGRMFSAYNPETGQTHDWVSIYKGFAMFSENDPSLGDVENKYLNTGNESDPARAFLSIFVSNWEYRRKDKEPRISPDKLMRVRTGLITPEAKWALYLQMEEEFLREYKAGRIFDEGKHITIGDVQIKNQLPMVVLVRGRDDNNEANSVYDRGNWMKLEYDVDANVLQINMFPPRRIYETFGEFGTGDELSILRALFAEKIGVGEGGTSDWSSVLTLVFLDGRRIGEEMKDPTYGFRNAEEIPIAYPGFSPSKYNLVTSP